MDIFKALRIAIRSEVAAQKMYNNLAKETSDHEAKSLFDYLTGYEAMHQQFLEAELRALVAAREGNLGKPSHWLKLLKDELSNAPADRSSDRDLTQCRLDLYTAENIAKILKNANNDLLQEQVRYEQEMNIAADIQRRLLPRELPQNTGLQIAAINIMARSVGGDYYDFISNERGQLALVVADSMGKGMPAALLMTVVRTIWRSYSATNSSLPGQALDTINRVVYPDLKATEAFVTMFSALYDTATSIFRYSSAGHNPPLFRSVSNPQCTELNMGGPPIGIFPDSQFPVGEFTLSEGDIVVLYTDGVVEAANNKNELFGFERLCDLIEQNRDSNAEEIKNTILSEVNSYTGGSPQADDITIVVLRKI